MSLESELKSNTEAVTALTAALLGSKTPSGSGKKTDTASEPKHDLAAVTKACLALKDHPSIGEKVTKDLISDVGKAKALKDVKKENFDALYDAAVARLAEAEEDGGL